MERQREHDRGRGDDAGEAPGPGVRRCAHVGYLTDLFPTALELAGLKQPATIRGIAQTPLHGASLVYSIEDATAPERHTQQYFTILGNRAIYKDGWKASVAHRPNGLDLLTYTDEPKQQPANDPDAEVWELYDLRNDFNEQHDLAKKHPGKLKELKALFDADAAKYGIYPLLDFEYAQDRRAEQERQRQALRQAQQQAEQQQARK